MAQVMLPGGLNGSSSVLKRKRDEMLESDKNAEEEEERTEFPCSYCSATFVTHMSLTRHLILHDDEEEDSAESEQETGTDNVQNDEDNHKVEAEVDMTVPVYDPEVEEDDREIPMLKINQSIFASLAEDGDPEGDSSPSKIPKLRLNTKKPLPDLKPLSRLSPTSAFLLGQNLEQSSVKQFQCETCFVLFGKKEDLSRHVTRTHGGARFTCPYCSRNISRRDHLKRHIKNVHPEFCTETVIGPFLADPNASRADKEQHAENFVAQYGVQLDLNLKPKTGKGARKSEDSKAKVVNQVQHMIHPQALVPFNQNGHDQLYEEGDDEFEGEDDDEDNEGMQQITVEPELPPVDDYYEDDEDQPEMEHFSENDSENYQEPPVKHEKLHQLLMEQKSLNLVDDNSKTIPNEGTVMLYTPTDDSKTILNEGTVTLYTPTDRKFKCELCEASFISNINLQRHLETHSIIRPHKCNLCGKGFLRKEHLTKHMSSVHSGMKYTCQFCGKDISRKDHLLRHIRNCHPAEFAGMPQELIQADIQQTPISQDTDKILMNMLVKPKVPFLSCDICFETFHHIDELYEHQSSVHSDVRKYKCPHCPKAFKRKEHLLKHEVLHTGEKKFACNQCGKVFPRKDAVTDHVRRVHNNLIITQQAVANFPCNLCDNVFSQQAQLNSHLKTLHKVRNSSVEMNGYLQENHYAPQTQQLQRYSNGNVNGFHHPNNFNSKNHSMGGQQTAHSRGTNIQPSKNSQDLGNLMGLINNGSLSLSYVNANANAGESLVISGRKCQSSVNSTFTNFS